MSVPLDYETLLAEPLEEARARLNIARPTAYEAVPLAFRNGPLATEPAHLESFGGWTSPA